MSSASGSTADVVVVGGGVAGLSAAASLAARLRVILLEREPRLASQASGNSAAIFRPLEQDARSIELPRRSRELLAEWLDASVLDSSGLLLVSDQPQQVQSLANLAWQGGLAHAVLDRASLAEHAPSLAGGQARHGLLLHDAGVLDVPALTAGLASLARARGAELRTQVGVHDLERIGDRVRGVRLADGGRIEAPHVIVAAGAHCVTFGAAVGTPLPLDPLRRHLVQLETESALARTEPVIWRLEDEVYYRLESGGVLASPCDETRTLPLDLQTDSSVLESLERKLERLAPVLARAKLKRVWACLRTFAADRELVVGEDPRLRGLHWFAGLGGRGMSVAPAAAELLSAGVLGERIPPLATALSPARLL